MKIGTIIQWPSNTLPDETFLWAHGQAVSRTTYADLFSVIGTTYGAGDGSTTFNVPDLRGRVGVGKSSDTEFDTLGETGGEKTHTLTIDEMPSHSHNVPQATGLSGSGNKSGGNTYNLVIEFDVTTESVGGGQAHNILQPYIVTNYIIKATIPDTIKISELESASAITSNDVLPIVQNGETKKMNVLDMIYPVGSIYISILNTNPSTYFGGTWQAFGQGRTLVGLKTSDSDFDELLKAGGEKTHTLTIDEIPSHNHTGIKWNGSNVSLNQSGSSGYGLTWESGAASDTNNFENNSTGGGQPHNIMQPYIVVSMWLRIG